MIWCVICDFAKEEVLKGSHGLLHRLVSSALIGSLLLPYASYAEQASKPASQTAPAAATTEPAKVDTEAPPIAPTDLKVEPAATQPNAPVTKEEPAKEGATAPTDDATQKPATDKAPATKEATPAKKTKYDKVDRAIIEAKSPELTNDGKESNYSMAQRVFGESFTDATRFSVLLVATVIPSAIYYRSGWKAFQKNARKEIDLLKNYANKNEWEALQKAKLKADQKLEKLILQAKSEDAKLLFEHLPESVKSKVIGDLAEQGVSEFTTATAATGASATTLEQLVDAFGEYHRLNKTEYELLKDLGPNAEKRLNLAPGAITAKLANPDQFMSEVTGVTTAVPELSKFGVETGRYVGQVESEATSVKATWRAMTYGEQYPLRGLSRMAATKNLFKRSVRTGAPALGMALLVFGSYSLIRFLTEEPIRKQKRATEADRALGQAEQQAIFDATLLKEDALGLMVEILWRDMKDQYAGVFKTLHSPVSVRNQSSLEMVKQCHLLSEMDYLIRHKDPTEKGPEDQAARKKVEDLAKELGIPAPPEDKEQSVRYYRLFWMTLFAKLREIPNYAELKNIPSIRDRDVETLSPESREPTLEEIIDELAVASPAAMLKASRYHDLYRDLLDALSKLPKTKRTAFFSDLKEIENGKYNDLVKYLEAGIKTLETMKDKGLVDVDKNPLPLTDEEEAKWKAKMDEQQKADEAEAAAAKAEKEKQDAAKKPSETPAEWPPEAPKGSKAAAPATTTAKPQTTAPAPVRRAAPAAVRGR